ncbi:HMG box domain containing 4 [Cricetulus griseus]
MRSTLFPQCDSPAAVGVCALGSTEAPWPLALFSPSPRWRPSAALRRDPSEPSEGPPRPTSGAKPGTGVAAGAAPAQGLERAAGGRRRELFKWGRRESCGAGRGRAAAPGTRGPRRPSPCAAAAGALRGAGGRRDAGSRVGRSVAADPGRGLSGAVSTGGEVPGRARGLGARRAGEDGKEPGHSDPTHSQRPCRTTMAYDDSMKKEDCFDGDHSFEDIGLAAGRSQREKKRSYKDFLREEEEVAAQVRSSSKKKSKDSELFFLGTDTHKKKRKHCPDDYCYGDISSLESSQKKKKKSSPQSADTAMDLLKAITSPLAAGAKSSKKAGEKSSSSSSHLESRKEHHKKKGNGSSGELSLEDSSAHKPKKMKPLYVNTETLTLREPDGLKMKLILSPKEKGGSSVEEEAFQYPAQQASLKKSSKKLARDEQGALLLGQELQSLLKTARKKHKSSSDSHSSPGPEGCGADASQLPEPHSANLDVTGLDPILVESESSSGGELEAGELPKKKNMSAYQVFCKEYRVTIVADHPGIASSVGILSPQKKSPPTTMLLPASPAKAPETEPIDVAAHLQLLGESLSLIGHRLQETERKMEEGPLRL